MSCGNQRLNLPPSFISSFSETVHRHRLDRLESPTNKGIDTVPFHCPYSEGWWGTGGITFLYECRWTLKSACRVQHSMSQNFTYGYREQLCSPGCLPQSQVSMIEWWTEVKDTSSSSFFSLSLHSSFFWAPAQSAESSENRREKHGKQLEHIQKGLN